MADPERPCIDDWYRPIEMPLSWDDFLRIPRHPDFKYEYFQGRAFLTPRPKSLHAVRALEPCDGPDLLHGPNSVLLEDPLPDSWEGLTPLFSAAFERTQPFASFDDENRRRAGLALLDSCRRGGDGPVIWPACRVAREEVSGDAVGALLVTLYPDLDPEETWNIASWREPPPPDAVERVLGRPHLTWIFVAPAYAGRGLGSAMLAQAMNELHELGFSDLLSSFAAGNARSILWHWRNGFRLLESPGSRRCLRL